MPFCDWELDDWSTLTFALQQKNCILMLGPDIPMDDQPPQSHLLAQELAEKIKDPLPKEINKTDLAQMSQCFQIEEGRMKLLATVSAFHQQKQTAIPQFYRDIAALPFELIITASHDQLLTTALENEGKQPLNEFYHFKGKNLETIPAGSTEKPLVYSLYGSISNQQSLVLTENDLLDFLVGLSSKERPLPTNLLSRLQDQSVCFLFLGFGFRHWYLRILLYILQGCKNTNPSFAMEELMIALSGNKTDQIVFYIKQRDLKARIYNGKLGSFAASLCERAGIACPTLLGKGGLKRATVFICHANEDKKHAHTLYRLLKKAGMDPWLDLESLKPGDAWNNKIEEALEGVDYVIVLNSKALASRHEGYVVREINCALERQKQFRREFRFIFPVRIDDAPLLSEIAKFQCQDLPMAGGESIETGFLRLTASMQQDYIKRKELYHE